MSEDNVWRISKKKFLDEAKLVPENKVKSKLNDKFPELYKVKVKEGEPKKEFEVHNIDIKLVNYNFENVRIGKYKKKYCVKNDIDKLDPEVPKHQEIVQTILLNTKNYGKTKVKDLEKELKADGQEEPALITQYGTLWNGNRRVAKLRKMYEQPESVRPPLELNKIKVCFLPNDLEDADLRALEKRLQQDKDTKEDYGLVSEMWKIKSELDDYDFEIDMESPTEEEKKELMPSIESDNFPSWSSMLEAKKTMELMDDFLEVAGEVYGKPMDGDYEFIEENKDVTYFVDLNKLLEKYVRPHHENKPGSNTENMVTLWKKKGFVAYFSSTEWKKKYTNLRKVQNIFENATGSGEPGDSTVILDALETESPIISEADPNESVEKLVALSNETRDVDGIPTTVKDIEQESFISATRKMDQLKIDPAVLLKRISEDLKIILTRKEYIPKKNDELIKKVEDCEKSLDEIRNTSNESG